MQLRYMGDRAYDARLKRLTNWLFFLNGGDERNRYPF
jgi:hypothetical protein